MGDLSLSVTPTNGRLVITVAGDLDMTCADQLTTLAADDVPEDARVIVDLTALAFLDSAGLGALLNLWKRQQNGSGDMIIAGADERNARALWLTGLADHLPHTPSLQEALNH